MKKSELKSLMHKCVCIAQEEGIKVTDCTDDYLYIEVRNERMQKMELHFHVENVDNCRFETSLTILMGKDLGIPLPEDWWNCSVYIPSQKRELRDLVRGFDASNVKAATPEWFHEILLSAIATFERETNSHRRYYISKRFKLSH